MRLLSIEELILEDWNRQRGGHGIFQTQLTIEGCQSRLLEEASLRIIGIVGDMVAVLGDIARWVDAKILEFLYLLFRVSLMYRILDLSLSWLLLPARLVLGRLSSSGGVLGFA